MTALREAAQQALEALEEYQSKGAPFLACDGAVAALRAALAQQEEPVEPVAWIYQNMYTEQEYLVWKKGTGGRNWTPLYAAPPRCPNCASLEAQNTELDRKLAELDQDETAQGPVAWMVYIEDGKSVCVTDNPNDLVGAYRALPLYTAPPQRKPLTDEEIRRIIACIDKFTTVREGMRQLARAVERAHGIGEQP